MTERMQPTKTPGAVPNNGITRTQPITANEQRAYILQLLKAAKTEADFSELQFAIDGLKYIVTVSRGGIGTQDASPKPEHVKCSVEGCTKTSREFDACLLKIGNEWRCRDHHPEWKGLQAPGWTGPEAEQRVREDATKTALLKLNKGERSLVNSRLVD
jgi:hypothetical protein